MENREMNTDYLTGLCNRRGLGEIWQSLPADTVVHCLYIDVDNFKLVNDIYGHAKGCLLFTSDAADDVLCVGFGGVVVAVDK